MHGSPVMIGNKVVGMASVYSDGSPIYITIINDFVKHHIGNYIRSKKGNCGGCLPCS